MTQHAGCDLWLPYKTPQSLDPSNPAAQAQALSDDMHRIERWATRIRRECAQVPKGWCGSSSGFLDAVSPAQVLLGGTSEWVTGLMVTAVAQVSCGVGAAGLVSVSLGLVGDGSNLGNPNYFAGTMAVGDVETVTKVCMIDPSYAQVDAAVVDTGTLVPGDVSVTIEVIIHEVVAQTAICCVASGGG